MSTYGKNITLTLFGESHGKGVGALVTGLPAGETVDQDAIKSAMSRRKRGGPYVTSRTEPDDVNILSGVYKGRTTGAPLTLWIENKNQKSEDYEDMPFRPGHADYTAHVRYGGYDDPRGGGYFSGRLTAPLTAAGNILIQILNRRGINITSKIEEIGGEREPEIIKAVLEEAKKTEDSVGGIVTISIKGAPAGVGGPRFHSLQSELARALYGVGAVKSVAFGSGEEASRLKGSEQNDPYYIEENRIRTETNNAGGILGGITNGEEIAIRVAVKPTPSIGKAQHTVNRKGEEVEYAIEGRHDTALVLRIPVALESAAAFAVADSLIAAWGDIGFREMKREEEQ